jgi:phosphate-selective porin OprO/OprP
MSVRMINRKSTAGVIAVWWLCAVVPASAQVEPNATGARAQTAERERAVRLEFDQRPSVRVGGLLRLDIRLTSQADVRDLASPSASTHEDAFDLERFRVGIDGTFLQKLEYQVEREMRDSSDPWRDVYVNVRVRRAAEIRAGHFKLPFSLDQTTGSKGLDFTYRSLAASYLAPGRDIGVMVHGDAFGNGVKYEAGVFRRGGKTPLAETGANAVTPRTVAGRLVLRPWAPNTPKPIRALAFGLAVTSGRVPEGLNGLRGRTVGEDVFFERVYVNGLRRRMGVEMQWRMGPVSAQGEAIRVRDERRGQGIHNEDLPDVVSRGWYLNGTWLLTGERKKGTIEPNRPFLRQGIGALELAGRIEELSFGSDMAGGWSSQGPRAPHPTEKSDRALTAGVNWYLNEFIKVQADVVRELRRDAGRVLDSRGRLWSRTVRVQFAL